ncbi:bifunctional 4-hydroxy-2-oxoglutarate aldolase/2-dehydro-3-deoxy-phosphogluconate aldolase [Paenibacillus gansuensis]|uniref:Bifunctional 4-hydroxy-2-oxoglutarate aldolase/2-dehydro-3-deoxy-phosphogluconate aldolase n=1 Tax=Paenibacillus gansuensis TaxID=306542 RepID=A0ABW5PFA2_9BACL
MSTFEAVVRHKIIAILRGLSDQEADAVVEALADGGIRLVEATLNTAGALGMIHRWREKYDAGLYVGAGTVLNVEMAKDAAAAGAQFMISPNFDPKVVEYGIKQGIDVYPGVMTPTEIVNAWNAGAKAVKIFPSATLGLNYIKEIRAPLDSIPMIATGGVTLANFPDFLQAGVTAVGLGSSLADKQAIREGRFDRIAESARAFVRAAEGQG